ncbi:[citrate (pro-3S)-lyase] ligase [Celerinatantimonas diazotrophica]|uniref:[Citrate [pro-3S]-lyase] ligase n=1 Tax=Celerinatantimonas diazotrophica TaxID=412034 RepID=A0A4R1J7X2_9GAMM|nr:[citrate (pro-3S)-lyase] ligase [Celerinatantimonas diazotrophica]TCK46404.1 [citrate (pro-3S)-lyase] ligase [Celerinatantimonas diazotrophica]CAG9295220.1 [Citrate [pro-3S]-lyase] ligase [Celerinatantimonas diazotrophica]
MNNDDIQLNWTSLTELKFLPVDLDRLLKRVNLHLDQSIEQLLIATYQNKVVGCAGLSGSTIRNVAVDPDYQGHQLAVKLVDECQYKACELGQHHLFLYTKPSNQSLFEGCGFYKLVSSPDALLMENTPVGIANFCKKLSQSRRAGASQSSIVINANPFTLGHRYLIEQACQQSDWLHLFVVSEDLSEFSYHQRLAMIKDGTRGIPNITLYPGGPYLISRATFPSYFLKDQQQVDNAYAAIDLLLFRNYIAPALGLTHRFIGTEPFCPITAAYNAQIHYWLGTENINEYPALDIVEVQRQTDPDGMPISASRVRHLLHKGQLAKIKEIVPSSTYTRLQHNVEPLMTVSTK